MKIQRFNPFHPGSNKIVAGLFLITAAFTVALPHAGAADYTLDGTSGTFAWEDSASWLPVGGPPGALDSATVGTRTGNTVLTLNGATSVDKFTYSNFDNFKLTFQSAAEGDQTLDVNDFTINAYADGAANITLGTSTNRVTLNATTFRARGGEIVPQNTAGNALNIGTLRVESGMTTFVGGTNAPITVTNQVANRTSGALLRATAATNFSAGFSSTLTSGTDTQAVVIGGRASISGENFLRSLTGAGAAVTYASTTIDDDASGNNVNITTNGGTYTFTDGTAINALRLGNTTNSATFTLSNELTITSGGILFSQDNNVLTGGPIRSNSSSLTGSGRDELWIQSFFSNSVAQVNATLVDNGSAPLDVSLFTNPTTVANIIQIGGTNTHTGVTTAAAGFMRIGNVDALQFSTLDTGGFNASRQNITGGTTGVTVAGSVTAVNLAGLQGQRDMSLSTVATTPLAVTLIVGNTTSNRSTTFNGRLIGLGSLIKDGSGTLTLTGSNTYAGDTEVISGTLVLGNGTENTSLSDTGDVIVEEGATLNLNYSSGNVDTIRSLILNGAEMPAGTYNSSHPSGLITGSGALLVTEGPGFSSWIAGDFGGNSVPLDKRGPNDDPDSDGINNLVEYAILGGDPTRSTATPASIAGNVVSFSKNTTATGITVSLEKSANLSFWTLATPTVNDSTTISYTLAPPTPDKEFVRLKVTQP
jgi:autotransporter-associated beta strand protein